MVLDNDLIEELRQDYDLIAAEEKITPDTIGKVFEKVGEKIANFKLRNLCEQAKKGKDDVISFNEFISFFESLDLNLAKGRGLKKNVQAKSGVTQVSGYDSTSANTVHSMNESERSSFSNFINIWLGPDPDCKKYLPLDPETDDIFKKLHDGVILCKLVNIAADKNPPIDERAIVKKNISPFTSVQNLSMALNSAKSIGLHITNIGAQDIQEGKIHLCLGILWQVIRKFYMISLNLVITPDLLCLLRENESPEDFLNLSPEEILLRWIEFQIRKVNCHRTVKNFDSDLKDSVVYSALQMAIMKEHMIYSNEDIESTSDLTERASKIIKNSTKAGIAALVTPYDIVNGNQKLSILYIAEMFNKYSCLQKVEALPEIEETREVKSYRNWMNSLGVQPSVTYFYPNLSDGVVLLQLCEIIRPGSVKNKIAYPPFTSKSGYLKKIENCNQVVKIAGGDFGLSVVNLAGNNIVESNQTLVLGLVWQLMRMFTVQKLATLSDNSKPLKDEEILTMVNQFYKDNNKDMHIDSFKDPKVITSRAIFEFVDAIKPGTVNWEIVNSGSTAEEKMSNAKYALSVARMAGATAYALPEDIVEGKNKMIMILFAFLLMVGCQNARTK